VPVIKEDWAMTSTLSRFLNDEAGATSIEYALIASFLSILIVAGATTIGNKVGNTFDVVSTALN
jgi:pilus assembly protein Flp/PilA